MSVSAFVREREKDLTPKPGQTDDMEVHVHMQGNIKQQVIGQEITL